MIIRAVIVINKIILVFVVLSTRVHVCLANDSNFSPDMSQTDSDAVSAGRADPLCGYNCLYSGLHALDYDPGDYSDFLAKHALADPRGASIGQLDVLAKSFGAQTQAVKTTLDHLKSRQASNERFVCIAHVDGNHFVNIADIDDQGVWIVDPPRDGMIAEALLAKRWSGDAILISREPLMREEDIRLSSPWKWIAGFGAMGGISCLIVALVRRGRPS